MNPVKSQHRKSSQPDLGPKVWFTGKSLDYVGDLKLPVSLEEWEWHEVIIDGYRGCMITDKILKDQSQKDNERYHFFGD